MNSCAPLLQEKKRRGKYIAAHGDSGTPQLAVAGTESEMPVHSLLEKLSAILQIKTTWKSQSKTDLAMERENLQLPPNCLCPSGSGLALGTWGEPYSLSLFLILFF